ncbi:hypothetical protein Tco_0024987, partial [Tanacetum coccineum]
TPHGNPDLTVDPPLTGGQPSLTGGSPAVVHGGSIPLTAAIDRRLPPLTTVDR